MLSDNPAKTRGIERRWQKDVNRRWKRFTASAIAELKRITSGPVINDAVMLSGQQTRIYMEFIRAEIDRLLINPNPANNWQRQYQVEAYRQSLERFAAELRAQGESEAATRLEIEVAASLEPFTAHPSLGVGHIDGMGAIHRDALEFLFTRSYESLKGWTDKLAAEVRQIVFDAVSQGASVRDIAKEIRLRAEVSASRARLIAQTETNQAYGVAQVKQAERSAALIDKPIGLRWVTAMDARVRHLHATWHGTIATPEETAERKSISPWNCRCGLIPVVEGHETPEKQKKYREQRERLVAMERQR